MIIDTHGHRPVPVYIDDNDPILPQVAAGKLFYYHRRGYVVLSKATAHNGHDGCHLANRMMGLPRNSHLRVRYRDGNDCNLSRQNLDIEPYCRNAPKSQQRLAAEKAVTLPLSARYVAAERKLDPLVPDPAVREYVRSACLEAMPPAELDAWVRSHR